jgi:hypothetical protein
MGEHFYRKEQDLPDIKCVVNKLRIVIYDVADLDHFGFPKSIQFIEGIEQLHIEQPNSQRWDQVDGDYLTQLQSIKYRFGTGTFYRDKRVFLPSYSLIKNIPDCFKRVSVSFGRYGVLGDRYVLLIVNLEEIPLFELRLGKFEIENYADQGLSQIKDP